METTVPTPSLIAHLLNRLLQLDDETRQQLVRYAGSVVELDFRNTDQTLFVLITSTGLDLLDAPHKKPDVSIRGTPGQLFAYLMAMKNDEPASSGTIEITGNIALAQKLAGIARQLDPDWEDQLASWLGDVPARHTANLIRNCMKGSAYAARSLHNNMGEYLRHESGLVAARDDVKRFINDVDVLRNDVERLRLRIERLQTQLERDKNT